MLRTLKSSIKLFIIAVLALPAALFAQSSEPNVLIDTLSHRMAVEARLGDITGDIESQFEQNPLQIAPEENSKLLDLFDQSYDGNLLLDDFKSALQEKLDEPTAKNVENWLKKPEAESILRAQADYYTLQGKRKRVVAMYEMQQDTPDVDQTKLIRSMIDTTGAVQSSIDQSVVVLRSMIQAVNKVSDQRNFSNSQIDTIVNRFKMQYKAEAGEQLNQQWMIMYYHVPVNTLREYTQFVQSTAGQRLTKAVDQSIQMALESAADRFLQAANKAQ